MERHNPILRQPQQPVDLGDKALLMMQKLFAKGNELDRRVGKVRLEKTRRPAAHKAKQKAKRKQQKASRRRNRR